MGSWFKRHRLAAALLATATALFVVLALAYRIALVRLHERIVDALGAGSEVGSINLTWSAVVLHDLRLPGRDGFPAKDALRAAEVRVEPELSSLWSSDTVSIAHIEVNDAYLAVWRERHGGLRVLPGIASTAARDGAEPVASASTPAERHIAIRSLAVHHLAVEYIDAAIAEPPHHLDLDDLAVELSPLHYPVDNERVEIKLAGQVRPASKRAQPGELEVKGWLAPATGDCDLSTRLVEVDLVAFEPYLLRSTETGVRRGTLGLEMHSMVSNRQLKAPGVMTLEHIELASSGHGVSTFMGIPRAALIDGLANQNGRLTLHFELDGRVDDPSFSLQEGMALQMGAALANVLGVSISQVAKGVGVVGATGVETGEKVFKGIGDAVGQMTHHGP